MSELTPENERIDRALEGDLTPEELAALKADVIKDPKLRAEYVQQLWLHANLQADRESLGKLLETEPAPIVNRRWPMANWSAAAAACLTLGLSFFLLPGKKSSQTSRHLGESAELSLGRLRFAHDGKRPLGHRHLGTRGRHGDLEV